MIGLKLSFDFSQVSVTLNNIKNIDMTPALREAAIYQEASTKKNFVKESDPDGNKWQDLKPKTWLRKRSGSILREDSVLVNSITHYPTSDDTWVVGTNTEHGLFHQRGVPSRNLVARTFLGFSQNDIVQINQIFLKHLAKLT